MDYATNAFGRWTDVRVDAVDKRTLRDRCNERKDTSYESEVGRN